MLDLTPEEYRILTNPTRIEQWGAQQKVADKVFAQINALTSDYVRINDSDIAAINKAIEANRQGAFIAWGNMRAGGWDTSEWTESSAALKAAIS